MSKAEASNSKKRKKRGISRYAGVFFAIVIVYVLVNIVMTGGSSMQTTIVQRGTEEDVLTADGYIFRNSTVITSPASGYLLCEAQEDSRVKKGETVVSVYKNEINFRANSELRAIDEKIRRLSENSLALDVFSNDPVRIEQNISEALRGVHELSYEKNAKSVAEIYDSVNVLIAKKRIISGESVPDDSKEIEELKAQKAEIEKTNNVDREVVHSPVSGAFTAVVDGLEEQMSIDRISDVTPSYLKELDKLSAENIVKDKVNVGDPIGKIVNNFLWYVAVVVPEDVANEMRVGDSVGIRFKAVGGEAVSGNIARISSVENKKAAVVISSNKYIDSVYSTSKTEVELVRNSYEGFRIPAKSIRIIDKVKGVYVIRNDMARFVPVETQYTGEDWVIVSERIDGGETLKLYDELIVKGKDLYDGKDVR